jgi:hypothetical protein
MSDHGGRRTGAGRPKGRKNHKTEKQIGAVSETGMTPLEYLTSIYQNEMEEKKDRIDAAKAAAPYVHAKLSSIDMTASVTMSHEDILELLDDGA